MTVSVKLSKIGCIAGIVIAVITACSNDANDCMATESCAVVGADLAVTEVTMGTPGRTHPVTGRRVVDSPLITYKVANLGTVASVPTVAKITEHRLLDYYDITDSLPALQPGASITRSVTFTTPRLYFEKSDFYTQGDVIAATVRLAPGDSVRTSNNEKTSDSVHYALPIIRVDIARPTEPHVRVNDPIHMSVTVTNSSALVSATGIQLRHCMWDYDVACWAGQWTTFGDIPLLDLAPGETRTINYVTAVTPTAVEEGYFSYSLSVCVTPRSETAPYRPYSSNYDGSWACGNGWLIDVWQDFEACAPPVLGAQPATLTSPNCGHYPMPTIPGNWKQHYDLLLYYVFALDAVAGRSYRVTGLQNGTFRDYTGWTARDLDPAANQVRFPQTGRYYLLFYASSGTRTVSAVAVP